MSYEREPHATLEGPDLLEYIDRELDRVSVETAEPQPVRGFILPKLSGEPRRIEGLTVLADGIGWNPGGGQGVYTYYGGVWNKLG